MALNYRNALGANVDTKVIFVVVEFTTTDVYPTMQTLVSENPSHLKGSILRTQQDLYKKVFDESLTLVWAFHHQYPCPWTPVYPGSCAYTCRDATQPQNVAYICTHIRIIRLHVCIHTDQLCTRRTEGVLRRLSGNKSISFIIFASLTGSSCLRNVNDVFAHAFSEPAETNVQRDRRHHHRVLVHALILSSITLIY